MATKVLLGWLQKAKMQGRPRVGQLALVLFLPVLGCAHHSRRPCSEAGQASRETGDLFRGIKRCQQIQDERGITLNHGKYREYYNNDKLALKGEYDQGKKSGRWITYDEKGQVTSDRYFSHGVEIPDPNAGMNRYQGSASTK